MGSHQEEIDADEKKANDNDLTKNTNSGKEDTKPPETVHTTQTNKPVGILKSSDVTTSEILSSPNVKNIDAESRDTVTKTSTDVQIGESELSNDKNLNCTSASTLERETKKREEKEKH